ncbi:hypothetical protein EYF80_054873 [Liparis tanakae]|uniref:Uncharacterized protein n=1 Tax=Liparis tanakae TaxID=230148 RepID=A0A4Z2F2I5_9TELE|nr:hypothetical protein EYF80_054873 [Liparis tanakae]
MMCSQNQPLLNATEDTLLTPDPSGMHRAEELLLEDEGDDMKRVKLLLEDEGDDMKRVKLLLEDERDMKTSRGLRSVFSTTDSSTRGRARSFT